MTSNVRINIPDQSSKFFANTSDWLAWVRALVLNGTAVSAERRQLSFAADRAPVPLVYGDDRLAGLILNVVPHTVYAANDYVLVQVLWAKGEVQDVVDFRLNDQTLDARILEATYKGTATQNVNSTLVVAFNALGLTYGDNLRGYAYSIFWMPVNLFTGELNFTARVIGRKVYDPRKDSTNGGTGAHRLATPSTWEWSDNPSLADADFLYNFCKKQVVWSSVITAANSNDELVSGYKRRTLGVTLMSMQKATAISETLRNYAAVFHVPTPNGIQLVPDRPASSVATYSHSSGNIANLVALEKRDMGNAPTVVEILWTDRTSLPWRERNATAKITGVDAGTVPYRVSQVAMPGVSSYQQAYREAVERLNKLYYLDLFISFDTFEYGLKHQIGDVVTVTHPVGVSNKQFRLSNIEYVGGGRWRLSGLEYQPSSYSDTVNLGSTYDDTNLSDPLLAPTTPTGLAHTYEQNAVTIRWNRNPEFTVAEYEVRIGGTGWETATPLLGGAVATLVGGTSITWAPTSLGSKTIRVKARSTLGAESTTAASYTFTIGTPSMSSFDATIVGANYHLTWTAAATDLPIKFYRVKLDGVTLAEVQATEYSAPVDWTGTATKTFEVTPISVIGDLAGTPATDTLAIQLPGAVSSFTSSAVINNVLFYWGAPAVGATKLPVVNYEIRKGSLWGTAQSLGLKAGDATFTTWTEPNGGDFTYWIAPIDSAGNVGTPASSSARVSSPNNFRVVSTFADTFNGTLTNAAIIDGRFLAPIKTTETFTTHFTNNSWTTPQDQVTAGYELYIQPANSTGTYVNKYSLAAPISSTMISVVADYTQLDSGGNVTVTPLIEIADDLAFTTNVRSLGSGNWQAFASNFQYIRVTLTFGSSDGKSLLQLNALTVNVALQIETDSGAFAAANFSGTGSTTYYARVNFNKNFLDVDSITAAPKTTGSPSALTWMVVFNDQPDPNYFDIVFFNSSGQRVTTDFTWQATGVL